MPDCPLAEDCPSFSERIEGMGCQHYGDRGGAEWCQHYNQPIRDLKSQPVKPGEEIVVTVEDIHESGAGVGRTEDGFIVLVDGVLPDARAKVRIDTVRSSLAWAEEVERLPMEEEEEDDVEGEDEGPDLDEADPAAQDDEAEDADEEAEGERNRRAKRERLGSRDNFWGKDD